MRFNRMRLGSLCKGCLIESKDREREDYEKIRPAQGAL